MGNLYNFGRIIADQRKKRGMTQEELAAGLCITPQAVSKWENGVGYPDVTLFPKIAELLCVPIALLFGTDIVGVANYPVEFCGLPRVCSDSRAACYSDKVYARTEENIIIFADGSSADFAAFVVTNVGAGEIRLLRADECEGYIPEGTATTFDGDYGSFRDLEVTMDYNGKVTIHRGGAAGRVEATGTTRFISLLEVKKDGECLIVKVKSMSQSGNLGSSSSDNNKVDIYTGFDHGGALSAGINGSADIDCGCDFDSMTLKINGSGDIRAGNTKALTASINGSGDIFVGDAGRSEIKINGSGDVECASVDGAKLGVNGSGDISLGSVSGDLEMKINGSGDVKCAGGDAGRLTVTISGSGALEAERLTVMEAEIKIRGSADMTVGRIVERSVESLSKNSRLKVLQRG